jgi:hypothetical protein
MPFEPQRGSDMNPQPTSIGRIVHYVSYGTPGGEYPSTSRAAIITDIIEGSSIVSLAVFNPEGMFFNRGVQFNDSQTPPGGTWHWPPRV